MTPNGDNTTVKSEIAGRLSRIAGQLDLQIEMYPLIESVEPFEQGSDCELVQLAESLTGHSAGAVGFATEAPFLQALGMETIVMGPGSIDRAHQPDEYLELEQIQPCIALLQQCIRHYCL
jgi:acetylornithine deacetylase